MTYMLWLHGTDKDQIGQMELYHIHSLGTVDEVFDGASELTVT